MPDDQADDLHQPNDKLFTITFGVPENAAALLRAELPVEIAEVIDWSGLRPLPGSFVDSQYRRSHTDLLFSAPMRDSEALIYVLFEHQSSPDRWLPLRLLRYMSRIWESLVKSRERIPGSLLPVILPVVLSQNDERWDQPTRLAELLELPASTHAEMLPYVPDFSYRHVQLAEMGFDSIPGTPSGILVLRAMKAQRAGLLLDEVVWDQELILQAPRWVFQLVLRYILGTDVDKAGFESRLRELSDPEIREDAMTLAQRYQQEGRQEGRMAGRQDDVLEALAVRFGLVPDGLAERIREIRDEEALRACLRSAIRCENLDEFVTGL